VKRKITGVKIENRRTHASLLILLSDYVRPRDILEMTGDSYTRLLTRVSGREREREMDWYWKVILVRKNISHLWCIRPMFCLCFLPTRMLRITPLFLDTLTNYIILYADKNVTGPSPTDISNTDYGDLSRLGGIGT